MLKWKRFKDGDGAKGQHLSYLVEQNGMGQPLLVIHNDDDYLDVGHFKTALLAMNAAEAIEKAVTA